VGLGVRGGAAYPSSPSSRARVTAWVRLPATAGCWRGHPTTRVPLSPGERAEIMAELQPSERVVLRSFPPDLGLDPVQGRFAGADDTFHLLQLRAATTLTPSPPVPDRLAHTSNSTKPV
jgi:hypothetical protein